MVPNPYQASLDWHVLHENNADIVEDQYLIFNTETRDFQRYSAGGLDSLQVNGNRFIEPGNSFWVRLKEEASSETFVIPAEAIDNDSQGGPFVRSDQEDQVVLIELQNEFGSDYVRLLISENGALEYVHGPDISYRSSSAQKGKIALFVDENLYAAKSMPRSFESPVYVRSSGGNEMTMRVLKAPADLCGGVVDAVTGQVLDLMVGEEMSFTMPQSVSEYGRFTLAVHDFARAEAVMPSCPESTDGKVSVHVGEGVTANLSLLTPAGVVLDQLFSVEEAAEFTSVEPGDYSVVVIGTSGTTCPKSQREVSVPMGEQPELLGLNWTDTPCNESSVDLSFELYGGGTFGWTLFDDNGVVEQGAGSGEMEIGGLLPGTYVLDVDHACLQEFVEFEAADPDAPIIEWEGEAVVVSDAANAALLAANFTGTADLYRWYYNGALVGENEALALEVSGEGDYVVLLEAERNGCWASQDLNFQVVSSLRGTVSDEWSVHSIPGGWLVQAEKPWESLQWSLVDAAGRLVDAGQSPEGEQISLNHPPSAGVYQLVLLDGVDRAIISLIAP